MAVIVGAGPSGLLLAHLLLDCAAEKDSLRGLLPVRIFEARDDPRIPLPLYKTRQYCVGLSARGRDAISRVDGLWTEVEKQGVPSSQFVLHIGGRAIALKRNPDKPSLLVNQRSLAAVLVKELQKRYSQEQVQVIYGARCVGVDFNSRAVEFRLKGDETMQVPYDLLVGADGARSVVREAFIRERGFDFQQVNTPYTFKVLHVPRPAELSDDAVHSFRVVTKKDSGSTSINFGCFPTPGDGMSVLLGWSPETEPKDLLQIQNAQEVSCSRFYAEKGRAVLIGDAAHAMSNALGQGCNSSLKDVDTFTRMLVEEGDVVSAMKRYSTQQVKEDHAAAYLSQNAFPESKWLRPAYLLGNIVTAGLSKTPLSALIPPSIQSLCSETLIPYSEIVNRNKFWLKLVEEHLGASGISHYLCREREKMKPRTRQRLKAAQKPLESKGPEVIVIEDSDQEQDDAMAVKENHRPSPIAAMQASENSPALEADKDKKKSGSAGVVGSRIYDSDNGTSCHQCRQKTLGLMASCKSEERSCSLNFCSKCLQNRYGEDVAIVNGLNAWTCPRCRGICNCSYCMKKKGCSPTGMVSHLAKSIGCASVAEFLTSDPADQGKSIELKKLELEEKKPVEAKQRKRKRVLAEASITNVQANTDMAQADLLEKRSIADNDEKKAKKASRKRVLARTRLSKLEGDAALRENNSITVPRLDSLSEVQPERTVNPTLATKLSKKNADAEEKHETRDLLVELNIDLAAESTKAQEIALPDGEALKTVAGIELPQELIGPALQLLEFCSAFQKLLCLRDGQAEDALQEMNQGLMSQRGPLVHLHVKLLSFASEDVSEGSFSAPTRASWLESLKDYVSRTSSGVDAVVNALENGVDAYEKLELHTKLHLLNSLCDDCLSTARFREFMENAANVKVQQQQANDEISAARKEVRAALQKTKAAEAKRLLVLETNGSSLTADQCNCLLAKLSSPMTFLLLAEMQQCNAQRTEPVATVGSRIFWKLRGADQRSIVVIQDVSRGENRSAQESWSRYSRDEEEKLIKFMASERLKIQRLSASKHISVDAL
ncbi:hypothetical protein SELMODRAFT_423936 [Selaginella moellendorffii]|uniref:DDT domain-containing protein n=1 Tax=Selaginella moellendorffii TaxID=88036 RepID=D8SNA1_SELML|nr:hypothetical protein SELMODRAFT_423936 [Selaginella moellendorffii]